MNIEHTREFHFTTQDFQLIRKLIYQYAGSFPPALRCSTRLLPHLWIAASAPRCPRVGERDILIWAA